MELFKQLDMRKLLVLIVVFTVVFLGFEYRSGFYHIKPLQDKIVSITQKKDVYAEFTGEVYDLIKNEYWEETNDDSLSAMYVLGAQQLGQTVVAKTPNKEGVKNLVGEAAKNMDSQQKKEFTVKLADMVLQSLRPTGRSRLYSQVNEEALKNLVANADPNTDFYKTLGVAKEAPQEEVKKAYEEKVKEIKKEEKKPEEEKKKLAEADRAYEAVKTPQRRDLYDKYKIEPTVTNKFIKPGILYLPIKKISPQTFQEFTQEVNSIKPEEQSNALILDLHGNIGGSIDLLQQFLGPFIGKNQYAFEFYRRGQTTPYKTITDWLPALAPYKNIVILIDENTQSSAEVIASTLKKYNVGVVVGRKTKGWGTIERIFKLKTTLDGAETYSIFLVHTLTLREDGQPIEGRGVEPAISIDDKNWDKELYKYFRRQDLIDAVKSLL